MATIVNKGISTGFQVLTDLESGKWDEQIFQGITNINSTTQVQTGILNKGWRARILVNRIKSPMPKVSEDSGKGSKRRNLHYAYTDSLSIAQQLEYPVDYHKDRRSPQVSSQQPKHKAQDSSRSNPAVLDITPKPQDSFRRDIVVELKAKQSIILVNTQAVPYQAITLQNRPNEISINPQSNWVSVKSMGRNDPFMVYTGAETSIQLELSWYVNDPQNLEEVVNKCRLLESWTKANGYAQSPPVINILWGTSGLFDNQGFVLVSAPYRLTHFQAAARKNTGVTDKNLLPSCATQTLTFKKISSKNDTWEDMIPSTKLAKTKGIHLDEIPTKEIQ